MPTIQKHPIARFCLILMIGLNSFVPTTSSIAQHIEGTWSGTIDVFSSKLKLVFHVEKTEEGYSAKMDSPDQGARGVPVSAVSLTGALFKMEMSTIGARYEGTVKSDSTIDGKFSQMGQQFPLRLSKTAAESQAVRRPQEPQPPFPYQTEDVILQNKISAISLSGTLTLPAGEGPHPAVILISGSGPQDRNEELFGHKPFWVIADFLTRSGMAVLRYDDRGTGKSGGVYETSTTKDFATDTEAAIRFLRSRSDINGGKIGLAGHSEGGMIAPMIAASDPEVAFLILLAAPGIPIDSLMLLQNEALLKTSGASDEQIASVSAINREAYRLIKSEPKDWENKVSDLLRSVLNDPSMGNSIPKDQLESAFEQQKKFLTSPWMRYFLKFDPTDYLMKVTIPVLALNGDKDRQVPSRENLEGISKAVTQSGNGKLATKEFEGLNHLFQNAKTGLPIEYGQIEETFSPDVLREILNWLRLIGVL